MFYTHLTPFCYSSTLNGGWDDASVSSSLGVCVCMCGCIFGQRATCMCAMCVSVGRKDSQLSLFPVHQFQSRRQTTMIQSTKITPLKWPLGSFPGAMWGDIMGMASWETDPCIKFQNKTTTNQKSMEGKCTAGPVQHVKPEVAAVLLSLHYGFFCFNV